MNLSAPTFAVYGLGIPELIVILGLLVMLVAPVVIVVGLVVLRPKSATPKPNVPPVIEQGDTTGGIIPYKNPHALTSYYLAVFSIIPLFGFFLGFGAVGLGISGLRQRKERPIIRGGVHAWIGILGGGFSVLAHLSLVGLLYFA